VIIRPIDFARDRDALRSFLDERDRTRLDATEAAVRDGDAFVYVVDDGGVARGLAVVHLRYRADQGWTPGSDTIDFHEGDRAYLENIGIVGPLQGRGIGSELLGVIEEEAHARGKRSMWLHTIETNTRAHRFYERHGWTHEYSRRYPWASDAPRRVYKKAL
jgi:ribosomal protein S18 acetylase RimI-like enzyme